MLTSPHTNASALVFDDHKLVAESLAGLLERLDLFIQVRSTNNEKEVLQLLVNLVTYNDVFLFLDYYYKDTNSIAIFNEARRLSKRIKIIFITSASQAGTIHNILSYEPEGIISKSSGADVIIECIKAIKNKQQYVCPVISEITYGFDQAKKETVFSFTNREKEMLQLFAGGLSISEAAAQAHLSRYTVVNHRSNMMRKSGTKSIVELLSFARKSGLI